MRLRSLCAASVLVGTVIAAPVSSSDATVQRCGHLNGAPVLAYNLTCARAHVLMKHEPNGWGGANQDIRPGPGLPYGIALLFRERDMNAVLAAERNGHIIDRRLAGRPVVRYAVPYGE